MFKLLRLFVPLLVMMVIVPMYVNGPNGKPIMTPQDWLPSSVDLARIKPAVERLLARGGDSINAIAPEGLPLALPSLLPSATLYKWQDKKGHWHFSDDAAHAAKAAAGQEVIAVALPKAANRMPPPVMTAGGSTAEGGFSQAPPNPLSALEEAKRVKGQLEQRYKDVEQY